MQQIEKHSGSLDTPAYRVAIKRKVFAPSKAPLFHTDTSSLYALVQTDPVALNGA